MAVRHPFKEDRQALVVVGVIIVLTFVPTANVSSCLTLEILCDSWFAGQSFCLAFSLHSGMSMQGNTFTGPFQGGYQTLTRAKFDFPFHFSFVFLFSSRFIGSARMLPLVVLLSHLSIDALKRK